MYIKYDIKVGIFYQRKKYIIVAILFLFFCTSLYSVNTNNPQDMLKETTATFIDYFLFIFKGDEPFSPQLGNYFKLPLTWILYNVVLAYIVGDYPTYEYNHFANNVLIRIKSKWKWWISKCVWNMLNVIIFYTIGYSTIVFFNLFINNKFSMTPNLMADISMTTNGMESLMLKSGEFIFAVFALPIIVSMAVSLLQMSLSFILNSILSFIVIAILLVASIFLDNSMLISSGSMLIRNSLFTDNGINSMLIVIISIVISVFSIIIGYLYFKRLDILSVNEK